MELNEPLLRDHRAHERGTAAAALAGKLHGTDPGAAANPSRAKGVKKLEDLDQAAPNADVKKLEDLELAAPDAGVEKLENLELAAPNAGVKKLENLELAAPNAGVKKLENLELAAPNAEENQTSKEIQEMAAPNAEENQTSKEIRKTDGNELEKAKVRQEIRKNARQATNGRKKQEAPLALGNKELAEAAGTFAKSAAGSSMAAAADAFCRAANDFAGGKDIKKRVMETELSKTAMVLFSVAQAAPSSEAGLVTVAIKLTSDAQMCLLSDTDRKPGLLVGWWRRRRPSSTSDPEAKRHASFRQRLRAAISAPEPLLPIHAKHEKQLVGKREVLYALALGAPVFILTSAAALHIFPGAWAWVAGASIGVWILAASGTVLNQYSQLECERLAARHLGRLGVLGAALLFCYYAYRAFSPWASWGLWFLLAIAGATLGWRWIELRPGR